MSKIFERNGTLKIISVIIAIILWLYAVSELNPETTLNITDVPVDIINEDALRDHQLTLVFDPVGRVNIKIRGLVNDIRRVNPANIRAVLDLSMIDREGTQQITLNIEGLMPREVRLDRAPEITVVVNPVVTKAVPVEIQLTGEEPDGYFIHPAVVKPQSIYIYGAESLVQNVVQGIVQVNLEQRETTIEQSLPIRLVDSEGRTIESKYVKLEQDYAIVTIPIYPEKTVRIEPNISGRPAEGFEIESIEVRPNRLLINGEQGILDKLDSITTELVDIQGAARDVNVTVDLQRVEGAFVDPGQPLQVNVLVRIRETIVDRNLPVENILFTNLAEGLDVELISEPVTIHVRGPYTLVSALTAQSFDPTVDLAALEPGEYELPLIIQVPEGIQWDMTAETVHVSIFEQ